MPVLRLVTDISIFQLRNASAIARPVGTVEGIVIPHGGHHALFGYGAIGFCTLLIVAYTTCCVLVNHRPIDLTNFIISGFRGRLHENGKVVRPSKINRILATVQLFLSVAAGVAAVVLASLEGNNSTAEWILLVYWVTMFVWVAVLNMGKLVFPSTVEERGPYEERDAWLRLISAWEWTRKPLTWEYHRRHVFIPYTLGMALAVAALVAIFIEHQDNKVVKILVITTLVVVPFVLPLYSFFAVSAPYCGTGVVEGEEREIGSMFPSEVDVQQHNFHRALRRAPLILISMTAVWVQAIAMGEFKGTGDGILPWVYLGISVLPFFYL